MHVFRVVDVGSAETEELHKLAFVAREVGKLIEVFGADLRPNVENGFLNVVSQLEVVDSHSSFVVEIEEVVVVETFNNDDPVYKRLGISKKPTES